MSRPRTILSVLLLLALAGPPAGAQTSSQPATDELNPPAPERPRDNPLDRIPRSAQEGAVDPASYVLGPGDLVAVEVLGRVNLSEIVEVDPEGRLWIPDLGPIELRGLTLQQAREKIAGAFRRGTRGLDVFLRIVRLRTFKAYAGGEVERPGAYPATAVTRVSEVVGQAGGVSARGSRRNIQVRGPDGRLRHADLVRFERINDRAANPALLDGDQVFVPVRGRLVYLYAPVAFPGEYEYRDGDKLSDLIRIGGGFLPEALLERGYVLRYADERRSDTLAVDFARVVAGEADLELRADDRIFVPSRSDYRESHFVNVRGEVARPGTYPIAEGAERVSTLLERAGGLTSDAAPGGVLVVRQGSPLLERDPEFDRLSRLSRAEMTDAEYQVFRTKLASSQGTFRVDYRQIAGAAAENPGAGRRDVLLNSGDLVLVERRSYAVRVSGEVRNPGLIQYEPDLEGSDYIRLAGGFGGKAKKSGVRITRSTTGQTLMLKDVDRIEPGDLIYVPDKPDTNWLAVARDVLSFAASIGTLVIVLRR